MGASLVAWGGILLRRRRHLAQVWLGRVTIRFCDRWLRLRGNRGFCRRHASCRWLAWRFARSYRSLWRRLRRVAVVRANSWRSFRHRGCRRRNLDIHRLGGGVWIWLSRPISSRKRRAVARVHLVSIGRTFHGLGRRTGCRLRIHWRHHGLLNSLRGVDRGSIVARSWLRWR